MIVGWHESLFAKGGRKGCQVFTRLSLDFSPLKMSVFGKKFQNSKHQNYSIGIPVLIVAVSFFVE